MARARLVLVVLAGLATLAAGMSPLALVGALLVAAGAHRAVTSVRRVRRAPVKRRA